MFFMHFCVSFYVECFDDLILAFLDSDPFFYFEFLFIFILFTFFLCYLIFLFSFSWLFLHLSLAFPSPTIIACYVIKEVQKTYNDGKRKKVRI